MKIFIVLLLTSCALTARPVDYVRPGPIMCEPISEFRQSCFASDGSVWDCVDYAGRWQCYRR